MAWIAGGGCEGNRHADFRAERRLHAYEEAAAHRDGVDESGFDISVAPGVQVPTDYHRHFQSFDGKARSLVVEGAGGPSWFTEYNVLTGLSARSYGRFADFVTRISAVHVERGLPHALRRCGYKTFSLYPYYGAFLGAGRFQAKAGIEHFRDVRALGARGIEPDHFFYYFDSRHHRARVRRWAAVPFHLYGGQSLPLELPVSPELSRWRNLGNDAETDEYLRRQSMSAQDYTDFVERLRRDFPGEQFLIVRFGDHQPSFARNLLDPGLDDSLLARQIAQHDPRFLTTYDVIDAINFWPADLSSALDKLDAPYLPIFVQEAADCAGSLVRRAEEDHAALRRNVLSLRRRDGGATIQPAADRRRPDQGALAGQDARLLRLLLASLAFAANFGPHRRQTCRGT